MKFLIGPGLSNGINWPGAFYWNFLNTQEQNAAMHDAGAAVLKLYFTSAMNYLFLDPSNIAIPEFLPRW